MPELIAACCGLSESQSEDDGYGLAKVGLIYVCGFCLVEAGLAEQEPEN